MIARLNGGPRDGETVDLPWAGPEMSLPRWTDNFIEGVLQDLYRAPSHAPGGRRRPEPRSAYGDDRLPAGATRLTRLIPDEVLVGYRLCYECCGAAAPMVRQSLPPSRARSPGRLSRVGSSSSADSASLSNRASASSQEATAAAASWPPGASK